MEEKTKEITYRYGGTEFAFPMDTSESEVKRLVSKVYPAIKNSTFQKEDDGSISIMVLEGEKGR